MHHACPHADWCVHNCHLLTNIVLCRTVVDLLEFAISSGGSIQTFHETLCSTAAKNFDTKVTQHAANVLAVLTAEQQKLIPRCVLMPCTGMPTLDDLCCASLVPSSPFDLACACDCSVTIL